MKAIRCFAQQTRNCARGIIPRFTMQSKRQWFLNFPLIQAEPCNRLNTCIWLKLNSPDLSPSSFHLLPKSMVNPRINLQDNMAISLEGMCWEGRGVERKEKACINKAVEDDCSLLQPEFNPSREEEAMSFQLN